MESSSTKSRETSVSPFTPRAASTWRAQLGPAGDVHRMGLLLIGGEDVDAHCVESRPPFCHFVGVDDVGHDLVTHDVPAGQVDERDVVDPAQHGLEADEPRATPGHVDLGHVAGDHALGAEPDAGQEHLHLLGRGVLRLVEDDERAVERAAAHEGERRHLDGAALEQALRALGLEQVVEGVVERAQVRVDLGHQVAREEAEPLAGLDGGAGEDDPGHLARLQRMHGLGHGQVGLAGPGRSDPEGDDVLRDGVDVALLARRIGAHRLAAGGRATTSERSTSLGRMSSRTMSMVREPRSTSRGPGPTAPGGPARRRAAPPARRPGPSTVMRLPCTTICSSGKACSIWRRCSSRVPSRPAMRWLPGTKDSACRRVVMASHVMAKCPLSGWPPSTWRWRCGTEFMASGPTLKISR